MSPPAVAIVAVGDELLAGRVADGNGRWLAAELTRMGARVVSLALSGDAAASVADAVADAARRAQVVLVSGGLGPTDDDGTREGLARVAGVDLVEDPEALDAVRRAHARRGGALDARRRREARLPRGARPLANPEGTAPGVLLSLGEVRVFALPGVPRELRAMFLEAVAPRLAEAGPLAPPAGAALRAAGIREPDAQARLEDLEGRGGARLAFYPHEGELEIRFEGPAAAVAEAAAEARRRLGPSCWENRPIEEEVVARLRAAGRTVTTAESITGGLVAHMLVRVPGASTVFDGGWVTYSDVWKAQALGVPAALLERDGAVSETVARAMAEGARARAGTDLAVATTGFAGPEDGRAPDGTPIPAGTFFVACAVAGGATEVRRQCSPTGRTTVQRRAAVLALDLLRRHA